MRCPIAWLLALGILFPTSHAVATVPEKAFDVAGFRSLPRERKLDFVLSVLDARDAELQNVECKVVEKHVNVAKVGGARRKMNGYSYTLRRLGPTLWMHLRMLRPGETGEEVRQESVQNWDGKVGRRLGLPPTNGRHDPDGKIESEEYECFGFQRYSALLGFRVRLVGRSVPVTQWLRESRANPKATIELSDEIREGHTTVKVSVEELRIRRELWLDSAHGFAIVQYDQVFLNHAMDTLLRATELVNLDGIWVAKRAIGHNTTDYDPEFTEVTHELQEFHRGLVKPGDVDVPFPVGTSVIDLTRNISYSVLPGDRYKLTAFANPSKRLVYVPPQDRIVDRIDDAVSKLYVALPLDRSDSVTERAE